MADHFYITKSIDGALSNGELTIDHARSLLREASMVIKARDHSLSCRRIAVEREFILDALASLPGGSVMTIRLDPQTVADAFRNMLSARAEGNGET